MNEDDWFHNLDIPALPDELTDDPASAEFKERKRKERAALQELEQEEDKLRRIRSIRGSTIVPRPTRFLWRDRYPLGGLSLVAGKGEVSKSTLFSQQIAWLTIGDMKGAFYGQPSHVAYVVHEDELDSTVVPRLMAHGADMEKVHFLVVDTPLGEDTLRFPGDSDRLRNFIAETGVKAVFIDPLSASIQGKMNDPGDMRRIFQEIARICRDMGVSIIGLAHTRKAHAEDVVEALMGSVEQVNVSRSVHGLVMDPEDDGVRLLSCEKNNLADKSKLPTLRFRLESTLVADDVTAPKIIWEAEVSERASDILGDALHGHEKIDECSRWLYEYLINQGGEARFADIKEAAKGYSESMLKRARKRINVASKRQCSVPPTTVWSLPL